MNQDRLFMQYLHLKVEEGKYNNCHTKKFINDFHKFPAWRSAIYRSFVEGKIWN